MKSFHIFSFAIILFSACEATPEKNPVENADLIISNITLFDGDSVYNNISIAVIGEKIVAIDKKLNYKSTDSIDGTGKTIIPGLINSHVHISKANELQEAIMAGVFVVLDMHKSNEKTADTLRLYQDSLQYASFYSAGFGATVPNGHPTQYSPEMETIDSISAKEFVLNRIENNADYFKIFREPQSHPRTPKNIPPTLNYEQIDTLIKTAKEHDLLTIAHVSKVEDAVRMAGMGINGFAHIWEDKNITEGQLDSLSEYKVFMVPTLYLLKTGLGFSPLKHTNSPVRGTHLTFEEILTDVQKLYKNEIPILAGTDSPNFGFNHGTDLYKELVLLQEAGLSNLEVLKSATSNPAIVFGLDNAGFLRVSNRANFILIDGNPMDDINDIANMEGIWKNGIRIK